MTMQSPDEEFEESPPPVGARFRRPSGSAGRSRPRGGGDRQANHRLFDPETGLPIWSDRAESEPATGSTPSLHPDWLPPGNRAEPSGLDPSEATGPQSTLPGGLPRAPQITGPIGVDGLNGSVNGSTNGTAPHTGPAGLPMTGLGGLVTGPLAVPVTGPMTVGQPVEDRWEPGSGDDATELPPQTASLVRPYARTGGRTKPARNLDLEALVQSTANGRDARNSALISPEFTSVLDLCQGTVSVAEIAAQLAVPIGVARVIIADMMDMGFVEVMKTSANLGDERDPAFLRRVLSGLQRL